jgi:PIN domain nuclease of toxin-antitoxin system
VSAWEITIKAGLGRLSTTRKLADVMSESGFEELPLRAHHSEALLHLPMLHKDPFDRILIAQALSEGLTIVTRDRHFCGYRAKLIRA